MLSNNQLFDLCDIKVCVTLDHSTCKQRRELRHGKLLYLDMIAFDLNSQGRLRIWTEHFTLILLISKPFDVLLSKFQHAYNLEKNEFSPNLEGVAQKMGPPRPFQFRTSQGHGSLLR